VKQRLVICNEEDTDGRARVTRDEERVLPVGDVRCAPISPGIGLITALHNYVLVLATGRMPTQPGITLRRTIDD